jgi:hypothetical protein
MTFKDSIRVAATLALVVLGASAFQAGRSVAEQDDYSRDSTVDAQRPRAATREGEEDSEQRRLREGTNLNDENGYFREDGDSAVFVNEDGLQLAGLPNLNLERIVRVLKGNDEARNVRWIVSGTVTEFNGRNYLLISRAVYKSAATPSAPPTP